jgi:micrococcal nuclease
MRTGIFFFLLLTLPVLAGAMTYAGKVTSVHDGDTIRVLYHDGELKVRLDCIDAPELKQPYGKRVEADPLEPGVRTDG